MFDLEALRLELEIARAARVLYGVMCNCDPNEPAVAKAHADFELAIHAADNYPPVHDALLLEEPAK